MFAILEKSTMLKILVVDDSPTTRRFIKTTLIALGYHDISEADDGVEALKILKSTHLDMVITDWNMPNMNGIELSGQIRNDSTLSDIPIVMVTTKSEKEDIKKAAKLKINGYIVKPFNAAGLGKVINPLAEKKHSLKNGSKKNILNIKILISVDPSLAVDEIHVTKVYLAGESKSEQITEVIGNVSADMSIASIVRVSNNKVLFSAESINNEDKSKVHLSL
jgi:two-component system, chemotaxis family, chemotaxis protein CheY